MSLKKHFVLPLLVCCAAGVASADTIQLKDKAAVTGKVLAEKSDALVVDVGYTVLVIPRSSITSRIADGVGKTPIAVPPPPGVNTPQFYTANAQASPVRDVQDLVKQIGEAVVQVRTPGGLGSGFVINADGYLMTNFHVIEGETEISVEVYHQRDGQLERDVYKQVRIIAINKFHDLALLHIEDKDAPKFKFVALGSADVLTVGDSVFAIGSPMGLERTVTQGIISTKTRELEGELYLQTSRADQSRQQRRPALQHGWRRRGRDEHENHLRRGTRLRDSGGAGEKFPRPPRRFRLFGGQPEHSIPLPRPAQPDRSEARGGKIISVQMGCMLKWLNG